MAKAPSKDNGKRRIKPKNWLLPVCYLLGVLVYLVVCLFGLFRQNVWQKNGILTYSAVQLDDFTLQSIKVLGQEETAPQEDDAQENALPPPVTDCIYAGEFVTTDSDPQMIYARPDAAAFAPGIVTFTATANRPTGEIVLYYETKPGQGYSDTRRVWAELTDTGAWQFDLTGKKVYSIRLDPDSVELGVLWQVESITLGGQKSALEFFTLSAYDWLLLLALPLLFWAALRESFAALDFALSGYLAKRKRKTEGK